MSLDEVRSTTPYMLEKTSTPSATTIICNSWLPSEANFHLTHSFCPIMKGSARAPQSFSPSSMNLLSICLMYEWPPYWSDCLVTELVASLVAMCFAVSNFSSNWGIYCFIWPVYPRRNSLIFSGSGLMLEHTPKLTKSSVNSTSLSLTAGESQRGLKMSKSAGISKGSHVRAYSWMSWLSLASWWQLSTTWASNDASSSSKSSTLKSLCL